MGKLSGVGHWLISETSDSPFWQAYGIGAIERLSDFGSVDIASLRVERGVFEYLESFEKAHDCLDRESERTCRTAVDQIAGTQHVSAD